MKNQLYKIFLASILLCICAIAANARNSKVDLIRSNSNELHFSLTVDPSRLISHVYQDSTVSLYRVVQVAVPVGARVRLLSSTGSEPVLLPSGYLSDYQQVRTGEPLVEISRPFTVRGHRLVNLKLHPVASVGLYSQVDIRLAFEGSAKLLSTLGEEDPYFDRILSSTVVNYEQAKGWKQSGLSSSGNAAQISTDPFSLESTWYKVAVNLTGWYRITGADLESAGLSLIGLTSDEIHIYNGGGLPLPLDNTLPRPQLTEVALLIEDGGDGNFDRDDILYFYGEAVDRWLHQPIDTFITNVYTDRNIYWLSASAGLGGAALRMATIDGAPGGMTDTVITDYRRRIHTEQDNSLRRWKQGDVEDYYHWYWTSDSLFSLFVSTPSVVPGTSADIFIAARSSGSGGTTGYVDLTVNGNSPLSKLCDSFGCDFTVSNFSDGLNNLQLSLNDFSKIAPYLDYIDVAYTSYPVSKDDKLDLTLAVFSGTAEIRVVDNFESPPTVIDISSPLQPAIVNGYQQSGGLLAFRINMSATVPSRFYLAPLSSAIRPLEIVKSELNDLRADIQQADMIVVTHPQLMSAVDEYVSYRSGSGFDIRTVLVTDIMDNFSYGLYDPTAIRDFFKFAYENFAAPAPVYVLLVGDGSYDFRNILETGVPNLVPPFIHPFYNEKYYSDDIYVYFGPYGILDGDTSYNAGQPDLDRGYDMLVSRIPVKNASEMAIVTDKIKRYENATGFGDWRSQITLVADDEFTRDTYTEDIHTIQTETLDKNHIPSSFHRNKIYLWDFPVVNGLKPGVNDAIIQAINEGTLLINYVGHGNPDLWAHEHVFTRIEDLPRLNNLDRLPLVFTASCEIAFFDNPQREGMAEDLLVLPDGGAVAVISATRRVISSANAEFNQQVFDILLFDKSLTIAEALFTAKLQRQYLTFPPSPKGNDQAYAYLGDPMLKLGVPQLEIEFTQIPDSLMALEPALVSGRVVDGTGAPTGGNGQLKLTMFDSDREKVHHILRQDGSILRSVSYSIPGPTIFRGSATIDNGNFQFSFVPPLDIGYGGTGARAMAYAVIDDRDGAGEQDQIRVSSSVAPSSDSAGPEIIVSFSNKKDFVNGDFINRDDQLEIRISDQSGINLTGDLGHGITLTVDNRSDQLKLLTESFEYDLDSYSSGSLTYQIQQLEPGQHTFKIKAWDNANNSSSVEFSAQVVADQTLAIKELLNYPNPMADSTRFSYYLTYPAERFVLEIFTLSGRKIRSYNSSGPKNSGYYDDIVWYGKDNDLERVASGVYIFRAVAFPVDGQESVESFGKLILIN